ncbi:MAG: class I adenylate-forming enzyme family protein [Hyphomicrobiales bacterium]|nr:class I adenylate-forming enzyme family protein [Hyphomicrobiales bacterium]
MSSNEVLPRRFNMARYCLGPAEGRPAGKPALIVYDDLQASAPAEVWTYGEIFEAVSRIGGSLLAAGLQRGDRILIRMDNCSDYALLFFAAAGAGLVPIAASSQLTAHEVAFFLEDSGSKAIARSARLAVGRVPADVLSFDRTAIAEMRRSGPLADFADTASDDPAFLIYTSGTSAHPKGVLHAHRAAWGRRPMYRGWYALESDDVMLHAGAFNWTYTLGTGLTDPWANGATAVVYTGEKDVRVWPTLIKRAQATIFATVPTLYRQILKYCDVAPDDLGRLRHGLTAGEALPPAIAAEWQRRTGRPLYEAFGMSELSTYISSSPSTPPKPGSPGRPQAGRNIAILPVEGGTTPLALGEVGVVAAHRSDPGLMLGYWNRPQEEAEMFRGDWFLTGDQGSLDEDGYVWLAGRSDDMMNAMGYRVSPVEVEAVLAAHPDVQEAAAVEVKVAEDVSIVTAVVVWRDGGGNADALIAHAREHLAAYKVPREIVAIDKLPHTPNGKMRRADLRKRLNERVAKGEALRALD